MEEKERTNCYNLFKEWKEHVTRHLRRLHRILHQTGKYHRLTSPSDWFLLSLRELENESK